METDHSFHVDQMRIEINSNVLFASPIVNGDVICAIAKNGTFFSANYRAI